MTALPELILASTSPFRQASLRRLGVAFTTHDPQVDESRLAGELPLAMAQRLALAKAQAVAAQAPAAAVIAGDQVLEVAGRDYGKPGDAANARAQLRALAGQEGVFHCGTCILHDQRQWVFSIPTHVRWRKYGAAEIEAYILREPAFGSAGAAQLEGLGITLVERIASDDPSAIMGVPLIATAAILRELGFVLPG